MFAPGDYLFILENGQYHVVQILEISDDYLVKDYWESSLLNFSELDIRSWVKRFPKDSLVKYEFAKNEDLTQRDIEELTRFFAIEKGLNNRKQRTAAMNDLVQTAMASEDFVQALDLLTEWAMLEKYRTEIYLLREECLRKLGRVAEADYERHVYNTLMNY